MCISINHNLCFPMIEIHILLVRFTVADDGSTSSVIIPTPSSESASSSSSSSKHSHTDTIVGAVIGSIFGTLFIGAVRTFLFALLPNSPSYMGRIPRLCGEAKLIILLRCY